MEALRLHTFLKRKFGLDKVAYNITTVVKLKKYNDEDNNFEDLLQLAESFEQALEWARENQKPEDFQSFQEFKNERLEVIPIHLLKLEDKPTPSVTIDNEGPISRVDSQVNIEKTLDTGKPQDAGNTTESNRK